MIRHDADLDLLVAGALLDDLDPTELARFEAHQPGCERCAVLTDLSARSATWPSSPGPPTAGRARSLARRDGQTDERLRRAGGSSARRTPRHASDGAHGRRPGRRRAPVNDPLVQPSPSGCRRGGRVRRLGP